MKMNKYISKLVKAEAKWSYNLDGTKDKSTFAGACKTNWTKITTNTYKSGNQFIIRTGKEFNLIVIDVDIKKGDDGESTLRDYGINLDNYPTLKFRSPSGGYHYFYKYDEQYHDGWSKDFLPFVDMIGNQKGNGWFIFHDTDRMKCINDMPIADMHDDLFCLLDNAHDKYIKAKNSKVCNEDIDIDSNASTTSDSTDINDDYSDKYYDLLKLLDDEWFVKYSKWIEPAYALFNSTDIDKNCALSTWIKLLKEKAGSAYDYNDAINVWNNTIPKAQADLIKKNQAVITMAKFKKILGGSKNVQYGAWKDKYEPTIKHEKLKTKSDIKERQEELYDELIEAMADQINSYGESMIHEDNDISFADIQRLHRKTIDMTDIALLFNQTYVNIFQSGSMFLIIKEINASRCPITKEFKTNIAFTKVCFDKTVEKGILTTIRFNDEIIKVDVKKLMKDIASSINNYSGISFYPYGPKAIQNTPKNIFNIFTGFMHKYDPEFVPDDLIVNGFKDMYKEILCNNNQKSFDFEIKKLASIIQRPEIKTEALSIFKAGQGVGKSFLLMFLMKYVFGKHLSITIYDQKLLTARFNSHLAGKIFVILEEGVDLSNTNDISMFKGMIRAPVINIEYKQINVFDTMDCCMNFFIATNNDFNRLLGESDERVTNFNVCSEKYKRNTKYFGEKSDLLNNFEAGNHIFHYLANLDLSEFDVRVVPENNEKLLKKIEASPSIIRFFYKLYKNDFDEDSQNEIPFTDEHGREIKLQMGIESLTDEDNWQKITTIMCNYKKICESDFNTKPLSRDSVREKYLDKYFSDDNKREYKAGRVEYNINKQTIKNTLNKHFDTTEF